MPELGLGPLTRPAAPVRPAFDAAASVLNAPGDPLPGRRRVEMIMGTAISIDVRDREVSEAALDAAFELLRDVDRRFSTYKPDSEISRLGRAELELESASADVRWIMGLCDDLARLTGGYFDARRYRADGLADPTGVVKGWALEEAAFLLAEEGGRNFVVNGGGDIVARGEPEPGAAWRVGIRHPALPTRLAAALAIREASIATSGTYERGLHIVDPHTGLPATALVSLTVVGSSLTYADAYATAAFAMGLDGPAWVAGRDGYAAFAITSDERTLATPGLAAYRV